MPSLKTFLVIFTAVFSAIFASLVSYNEYKNYRNNQILEELIQDVIVNFRQDLDRELNITKAEMMAFQNRLYSLPQEQFKKKVQSAVLQPDFKRQFIQFVQGDPNKRYTSGKELMENWESGIEKQCGYWKRQVQIRDSEYNLAMRAKHCD